MSRHLALGAALLALASSCIGGKTIDTADLPADLSTCEAADGADTTINSAAIAGDTLTLNVGYGGGCEEHFFTLCWPDQSFMESDPVQVNLELLHSGVADPCDAYITGDVSFDLTPLKESWQASYGGGAGIITVHIGGQTVEYSF